MDSVDIRSRWLDFFESKNSLKLSHTVVPSASLIASDPNLLLVNAGMVPFKPFFLGEVKSTVSASNLCSKMCKNFRYR